MAEENPILSTDWARISNIVPGLADDWNKGPNYESCSILSGPPIGTNPIFRTRVQKVTRQTGKTGDIFIRSNDFGINAASASYRVEFAYRCSGGSLYLFRWDGSRLINLDGRATPTSFSANSPTASYVNATVRGNGLPFKGLAFYMYADHLSGPTIWFELDRVSCREIL